MAEWISVKDGLPERGERVLASVEGNGVFEAFLNIKKVWVRGGIEMERWYGTVTHWMPMPETPERPKPDKVKVVRCKVCAYANDDGTICHYGIGKDTRPERFCSEGERRESEVQGG